MIPVVALVGRSNVGKSTLFNRLTRTRNALVADCSGLTRNRKYGKAMLGEREFIVVDTGGIDGTEEGVEVKVAEQSLAAIEEADIVLFMVDGRAGLIAADEAIAQYLRSRKKNTFLIINKIDGIDANAASAEFWKLGMKYMFQIAAAHGRGVLGLIDRALKPYADLMLKNEKKDLVDLAQAYKKLTEESTESAFERFQSSPIKLGIIGRPNVGKSTLTNSILGEERVVVFDMPGTTRDSIYIPMERNDHAYVVIDTAGVRSRKRVNEKVEKFSVIQTLKAIEYANVVLLVIDARDNLLDQDLNLLGFTLSAGRSIIIAVNKWDGLDKDVKNRVKSELDRRLGFVDFARIHFISALYGTGIGYLFESIQEAYESATKRISTARLTQIMNMAQDNHQPPMIRGRRVRLKYAHAGGYNPPIFIIHGNQVKDLPDSYKRYLMNYFRKSLKIMGTPIRIQFQSGENPFESKTNKLTISQSRQHKHLLNIVKKRYKK
ncbi:ribosome biogenesis GTPase Der [Candidatus Enterovibrio altilux]|uniref:GTPase Der n=1 Tax=Candidatus Enterovibrio altilux TaxID=1927128 RepID=A0A291BBA0_9GAMM|nr:ribosome biogenesis GTPase Der [Candidatus Enterovibrio luxaltus]ATF10309.1 GTP-binding protein EngA [Candidatus Enterovibrio luxaltus]